jgi:hypothetical protein
MNIGQFYYFDKFDLNNFFCKFYKLAIVDSSKIDYGLHTGIVNLILKLMNRFE